MECFGTNDFDNNGRLLTLSATIISGLHCISNLFVQTEGVCIYIPCCLLVLVYIFPSYLFYFETRRKAVEEFNGGI